MIRSSGTAPINDATVERFYCETRDELRVRVTDFVTAYNFARGLNGLTSYEYIYKACRKALDPLHQMPGPSNLARFGKLYQRRRAQMRQEYDRPLVEAFEPWLRDNGSSSARRLISPRGFDTPLFAGGPQPLPRRRDRKRRRQAHQPAPAIRLQNWTFAVSDEGGGCAATV